MRFKLLTSFLLLFSISSLLAQNDSALRVFIRGGVKTHGPNQHDHPRFLGDWTKLLSDRGVKVNGAMEFPAAQQLENTDVLVIYAADGMKIVGDDRANFEKFLKRGGGLVVIHDGVVSADQHEWAKKVQGGAWIWENRRTKWYEGEVGMYFLDQEHPISRGISNFDWKDEIYYDLDMAPDAKVLATSFHSVFVIAPQMWTYEKTWEGGSAPYRAFVSLPGHEYDVFNTPHYRAILMRGIAWAGKRSNVDSLCAPEELASLKYPEGGPTAPEKAAAKLNIHPEFDINLVASESLIEKAISIDWDPKGRLWVAETPEYPGGRTINRNDEAIAEWAQKNPGKTPPGDKEDRPARDRISWLEDTDGDGRMDKKHVFADGLELVTSLVFYKDGVIVAQAPDILWLRDKDGDGKCNMQDERVVLYTGFGTMDTHAVINNFRWGMDGWIYSAIGYSAGNPASADGSKKFGRVTAGVIRFKPDGSALEQVASGSCNTWGFDFGPDNEAFYTTATCGEHFLHIVMPEKAIARANVGGIRSSAVIPDHQKIAPAVHHTRPAYIQIDLVGQFTATAGSCIYNGGAWPARWNGSHFCSETTMSLVHNEFLRPNGVTYIASKEKGREDNEFVAGTDLWFRPIHTRVGPDGALYVIDFYNQAAIHNDTRGPKHGARNAAVRPDRDHHFTRIWRLQHKQAKQLPKATLAAGNNDGLVKALEHPNGWVRLTAQRLLGENESSGANDSVRKVAQNTSLPGESRIHALWLLAQKGALKTDVLISAINDKDSIVRKNALKIVAEGHAPNGSADLQKALLSKLTDPDARVQLQALLALSTQTPTPEITKAIVTLWPNLTDKHLQSAALGVATQDTAQFLNAALDAQNGNSLREFVGFLTRDLANKQDAEAAAKFVQQLAAKPASTDALRQSALASLAANLRPETVPAWNADLRNALASILNTQNTSLAGAALPLVARWDKEGSLKTEVQPIVAKLSADIRDKNIADDQRAQIAVNLLGVRNLNPDIMGTVSSLVGSAEASTALQRRVIEALGTVPDASIGQRLTSAYPKVASELQEVLFSQLIKRADWSLNLVDAIKKGDISLTLLGPASVHRLRTHSDKNVAEKAISAVEAIRGPQAQEKDALIAKLLPTVEKAGNLANGKTLFTQNCANCHKFKGEGRDLAPDLTGMGAHGAHDLLTHILDPNRVVEPNFVSYSVETKDDQSFDGIIVRENAATVTLRNATSDYEIRKDNIHSRRSTGISLMPEGFDAIGAEGLRDLIAYLCADENKFRILDLSNAFTANSTEGIYNSREARNETLRFAKFGLHKIDGIPFEVVHPTRTASGNNLIVLKGGFGYAKTLPQKVEFKAGVSASKLHFLGGVGGWAWPFDGEKNKDLPVAKVTLHYVDGKSEEIVLKNGVEFADYVARAEVPGSKEAVEVVRYGQVRWFSKPVSRSERIDRIVIESYNNVIAPTFVAITAELAGEIHAAKSN